MSSAKIRFGLFFLAAIAATTLMLGSVNAASAYETSCAKAASQSEVLMLLAQR